MQIRAALPMIRAHRDITRRALAYSSGFSRARNLCSGAATGESGPSRSAGIETAYEEKAGMTTTNQYDIAIVGGGMVGLAFACALTSMPLTKQLSVAIIDSNPALQKPLKKEENHLKKDDIPDPRVSTVTPATISFFKDIGAWEYVQEQRHAFFDKMQVWDYTGLGFTRYNAKDVGKDYLGCVVENKVLCNSLLSCLQQNTDLDNTIYTARLISMVFESQNPSGKTLINQADSTRTSSAVPPFDNIGEEKLHGRSTKLELSDGRTLYAKLVVGADGAKSRVREIAGLKTTGWNYSQSAIICTVEHDVENHCAWQRFLPSGPIALLPVGNKFSNIVWTMSPEGSSIHKSMSADEFIKAVNHALDYGYGSRPQPSFLDRFVDGLTFTRQGAPSTTEGFQVPPKVIKVATERLAFPLSLMHARDYVSKRVALIGDAAHNVHPLAGQGVNLGFGDASALSKVISEGLLVGTDIGELSVLKRYEKERKTANVTMMAFLDGFQKAYSVDFGPVNLLRAAALHGAQYIPPLKRNIISFAMGDHKFPLFS